MAGAGDLDRRVTVERYAETLDEFRAPVRGWTVIGRWAAARADATDSERFAAGELAATRITRWTIRSNVRTRAITPRDRLIDEDGAVYEITGIREAGRRRRRYLELSTVVRPDQDS